MKAGNVEIKVGTHKNVVAMVLYVPAGERARYLSVRCHSCPHVIAVSNFLIETCAPT